MKEKCKMASMYGEMHEPLSYYDEIIILQEKTNEVITRLNLLYDKVKYFKIAFIISLLFNLFLLIIKILGGD